MWLNRSSRIIVKRLVYDRICSMISLQCLHINRVEGDITKDTLSSDLVELTDPMFEFQKVQFVHSHFEFSVSA